MKSIKSTVNFYPTQTPTDSLSSPVAPVPMIVGFSIHHSYHQVSPSLAPLFLIQDTHDPTIFQSRTNMYPTCERTVDTWLYHIDHKIHLHNFHLQIGDTYVLIELVVCKSSKLFNVHYNPTPHVTDWITHLNIRQMHMNLVSYEYYVITGNNHPSGCLYTNGFQSF